MKRRVALLSCFAAIAVMLYVIGCSKSSASSYCNNLSPSADSTNLKNFATANGITAVRDSTGLFYQILDSGTGAHPSISSVLYVTYKATLLNGTVFDSATNANNTGFPLTNLIKGWQIGLPKIGTGGHILLLVPSDYAYGCTGYLSISPNTPLFFDVTLVSFQ